jgi:RimJ/RimL family protein N-acetyltransferase
MEYGIQRRRVYLVLADADDLTYVMAEFDRAEVWEMFGFSGPSGLKILRARRAGNLVLGMLKRVSDRKRIGFVIMFPPTADFDFWEFGYAIREPEDRDAFSALCATDAMAHYMFDHLRVEAMGWRTRADNRAADAVVRRLGYQPFGSWTVDGHHYTFYRLDREGWSKRVAKLEAGEKAHPSGLGEVFMTLADPPYDPVAGDE